MTSPTHRLPPRFHEGLADQLIRSGQTVAATEALLGLDAAMFQWHRMAMKGEILGPLIAQLDAGMDLSHFSSLTAITRIRDGIGRPEPMEPTIGLLAEELNLDPSRASRIAADLIARGFVRRQAAQEDGRKSILQLTEKATAVFSEFRSLKWARLLSVFEDWTEDEITTFSALFQRYCAAMVASSGNAAQTPE